LANKWLDQLRELEELENSEIPEVRTPKTPKTPERGIEESKTLKVSAPKTPKTPSELKADRVGEQRLKELLEDPPPEFYLDMLEIRLLYTRNQEKHIRDFSRSVAKKCFGDGDKVDVVLDRVRAAVLG
jgi:hypothetical protein